MQPTLEFIDVDIRGDTRVFIDPRALTYINSAWAQACVAALQSFFSEVISSIQQGQNARARWLLASLNEPNETHLGLSQGRARGRGMGHDLAREVWDALRTSRAVSTGLLQDLEDTILFVPYIGHDRISDITTNIIRRQLIEFTQDAANYYGIPLQKNVVSGRLWDHRSKRWDQSLTSLPVTKNGRLLLVPKSIVRQGGIFDPGDYYTHYVLPYLEERELQRNSGLVHLLRSGRKRVYRKDLKARYGVGKATNLDITIENPALLDRYREIKSRPVQPPDHPVVAAATGTPEPDFDALLQAVIDVPRGEAHADEYHRAAQALLTAVLYPALDFPQREFRIYEGRKRIDINYTNVASEGFFHWMHAVHGVTCSFVPVECKNYDSNLGNAAFDQLAGRFSIQRGWLGLLGHRGFNAKADVVNRCRDTALSGKGYMIALDDDDMRELVEDRKANGVAFGCLRRRFQELI